MSLPSCVSSPYVCNVYLCRVATMTDQYMVIQHRDEVLRHPIGFAAPIVQVINILPNSQLHLFEPNYR